jgi:hypothetical protein
MTPSSARIVGGKKFMWDGRVYSSADEAEKARSSYERDAFESWSCEEDGMFLVYTRRVVQQAAVPPS